MGALVMFGLVSVIAIVGVIYFNYQDKKERRLIWERSQVEALCKLMAEFITAQKQVQLPAPELTAKAAEEKVRAEMRAEEQAKDLQLLQEENNRLRNEIKDLQNYKEKALWELCRVRDEQKTIGKIKVNTET